MPTATRLTVAQMVGYARAAGFTGNDAIIAGAVGMAESGGNPDAINYVPCVGIWQINVKAHPMYTVEAMRDPAKNAAAAYAIWKVQGWHAWTTYTSGAYKTYMPAAAKAAGADITLPIIGNRGGLLNPINSGTDISTIMKIVAAAQNPAVWRRVLLIIVGVILILIGVVKMSATPENIRLATKIAEVVPK